MDHGLPYAANCSLLFAELPLLQRPAAAREAGFDAVEFWWPSPDQPVPADTRRRPVRGGCAGRGRIPRWSELLCRRPGWARLWSLCRFPNGASEFIDNVDVTVGIGERLGARAFNALYGNRVDNSSPQEQDQLGAEQLTAAAQAAARIGGTVLVEPVSGPKPYPLRTASDVVSVLDRVRRSGVTNVGFLCDLFHLANNGDDLDEAGSTYTDRIAHVQIADHPGRHEPGTGTLDLDRYLRRIEDGGYAGWVGLEYIPSGATVDSLGWLPRRAPTLSLN